MSVPTDFFTNNVELKAAIKKDVIKNPSTIDWNTGTFAENSIGYAIGLIESDPNKAYEIFFNSISDGDTQEKIKGAFEKCTNPEEKKEFLNQLANVCKTDETLKKSLEQLEKYKAASEAVVALKDKKELNGEGDLATVKKVMDDFLGNNDIPNEAKTAFAEKNKDELARINELNKKYKMASEQTEIIPPPPPPPLSVSNPAPSSPSKVGTKAAGPKKMSETMKAKVGALEAKLPKSPSAASTSTPVTSTVAPSIPIATRLTAVTETSASLRTNNRPSTHQMLTAASSANQMQPNAPASATPVAQLSNSASSVEKVRDNLDAAVKKYNLKKGEDSDKVKWDFALSSDKKSLEVKDEKDNHKSLFTVKEAANNSTEFNFPKEPKLSERTALITLDACEAPIELDSTNMDDLEMFAKASEKLKKEVKLSENTLAHLKDQSLDNMPELKALYDKQKPSPASHRVTH